MARPKRPAKTSSPVASPLSLPTVVLSLFAAIAASFFASRALKKRSRNQLRGLSADVALAAPTSSDFPGLLRSLPDSSSSPSSSSRFSNDDPVVQVVVRQEIAHELPDEEEDDKIEDQFPVAVAVDVAVEKDNITHLECPPRLNGIDTTAVQFNLEVEVPGKTDEDGVAQASVERSTESIEQRLESNVADAGVEVMPVAEASNKGEEVLNRFVETTAVLENSAEPISARIQSLKASSEEGTEDQTSSEQSSVLINGRTVESYAEVDSEEENDELANGSSLSDCTSCSVNSEDSLQEVSSAAVKPVDVNSEDSLQEVSSAAVKPVVPYLEEAEDVKVGTRCAEVRSSELYFSSKDCPAHDEESNDESTDHESETIESGKGFSVTVDLKLNSDNHGGVALISPEYEVSIEPLGNKSSYSITNESSEVQESVGAVTSNGVNVSHSSDSEGNSPRSEREISALRSAVNEFQEAPKSSVVTPNDKNEETLVAENKHNSTSEIIDVEAGMDILTESPDAMVCKKIESSGESYNSEDNVNKMQVLEIDSINEETLQSEEELDRCSSSEDNKVRLYTGSLDRKEESTTGELDSTNESVESSNDINAEPERLSSNSFSEQNEWPKEQLQSVPQQDVVSKTPKIKVSEQEEKEQTNQIFDSKKFIFADLDLSETFQGCGQLSEDQIYASTSCRQCIVPRETPIVKVQKGILNKFAGHMALEMSLICVLIGLLSIVLWFLRSLSGGGTTGMTAQN